MQHLIKSGWLNISNTDSVFYRLHLPKNIQKKSTGIIIIGPMGPEYMYCQRTIKCLSQQLAQQGFYALRYDPLGMGNSSSDLYDQNIVEKWLAAPLKLSQHLTQFASLHEILFISLRSGALILSELLKTQKIDQAIYWFPYTNGKAWVRDLSLVDSMLKIDSKNPDIINGGGYPLTAQAQQQISQINLNQSIIKATQKILLIEDSKSLPNKKLASVLQENCQLDKLALPGMKEMLQQATLSVVPQSNLDKITQWTVYSNHPSNAHQSNAQQLNSQQINSQYEGYNYIEHEIVIPGEKNLYGIFCRPKNAAYTDILLLANAGSGHHVGPNRLNVDIARSAADYSLASYRFDLAHLGESTHDDGSRDNHPYAQSAAEDVIDVIKFLSENYTKNIVLVGLCSAGYNFFRALIKSDYKSVKKLIVINPLTFYYQQGNSIFSPQDSSLQVKILYASSKALKEQKNKNTFSKARFLNITKYTIAYLLGAVSNNFQRLLFKFGVPLKNQLDKDLFNLHKKNIQLTFLCSDTDPGYFIITNQAPVFTNKYLKTEHLVIKMMTDSDHTFSSIESRNILIQLILANVK